MVFFFEWSAPWQWRPSARISGHVHRLIWGWWSAGYITYALAPFLEGLIDVAEDRARRTERQASMHSGV